MVLSAFQTPSATKKTLRSCPFSRTAAIKSHAGFRRQSPYGGMVISTRNFMKELQTNKNHQKKRPSRKHRLISKVSVIHGKRGFLILVSNQLYFAKNILRKPSNLHAGSGGSCFAKILCVYLIKGCKIIHVLNEAN